MAYPPQFYSNQYYRRNHANSIRVMKVYGNGSIYAEPNMANVMLGVETRGEELSVIQNNNATIINAIIELLLQLGLTRNDIQTANYAIRPEYDYVDGVQQFRGYIVTHILRLSISEISRVGEIIDRAVASGANRVQGISFSIRNEDEYVQTALIRALENATEKARALARSMNVAVETTPISIKEQIDLPVPINRTFVQAEGLASTSIEPGQLEITAQVEAEFKYGV